jgi:hypothetical protein
MYIKSKRGFELSFSWLFAIIAGTVILFLAIYATVKLVGTNQHAGYTEIAKQLSIIFNPLDVGMASGKSTQIQVPIETRIYNKCSLEGAFGKQLFSISQKSGFVKQWPEPGGEITVYNKYVFSDKIEEGKDVYFFSKPFKMPFKVSEIIFMSTKSYCFLNAPDFIKEEIEALNPQNIKLDENCSEKDIDVCFGSGSCEIKVVGTCGYGCENSYERGYTEKNGKKLYFAGSLMYGSIFSEPEVYECNFRRLMARLKQISYLYADEISFISAQGCSTAFAGNLLAFAQTANYTSPKSESGIIALMDEAEKIDSQNSGERGGCRIYD